jgi:drug/metabolite transporter (DMT)-like permease
MTNILMPLAAAVLWGACYAMTERLLRDVGSPTWLFVGTLVWIPVSLVLAIWWDKPIRPLQLLSSWPVAMTAVATLATSVAASLLSYASISRSGAYYTGAVEIAYPVFIPVFAWLLYHQAFPAWKGISGMVLVLCGIALLMQQQAEAGRQDVSDTVVTPRVQPQGEAMDHAP